VYWAVCVLVQSRLWLLQFYSHYADTCMQKQLLLNHLQWPWTLTFLSQNWSTSCPCCPLNFTVLRLRNIQYTGGKGRTDKRTEGNAQCSYQWWGLLKFESRVSSIKNGRIRSFLLIQLKLETRALILKTRYSIEHNTHQWYTALDMSMSNVDLYSTFSLKNL